MDAADLVAGVDNDGLARFFIGEDGAIALQGADGKGLKDHGFIVGCGKRALHESEKADRGGSALRNKVRSEAIS